LVSGACEEGFFTFQQKGFGEEKERVFGFIAIAMRQEGEEKRMGFWLLLCVVEQCKGWHGIYICVKRG